MTELACASANERTTCRYLAFTPMHDAVHSSIAPTNRPLNDAIGYLSSVPFNLLFKLFKLIHLYACNGPHPQHPRLALCVMSCGEWPTKPISKTGLSRPLSLIARFVGYPPCE